MGLERPGSKHSAKTIEEWKGGARFLWARGRTEGLAGAGGGWFDSDGTPERGVKQAVEVLV